MSDLFRTNDFTPHGFCLAWDPDLMIAMVLANALIAFAYMLIAIVLVNRALAPRPAVPRWFYWTFAAFIFSCGVSHVLDDVTLWLPVYHLQAAVLGVTAMVSMVAAILPITIWVAREADHWRQR
jgi:hypothetical protein